MTHWVLSILCTQLWVLETLRKEFSKNKAQAILEWRRRYFLLSVRKKNMTQCSEREKSEIYKISKNILDINRAKNIALQNADVSEWMKMSEYYSYSNFIVAKSFFLSRDSLFYHLIHAKRKIKIPFCFFGWCNTGVLFQLIHFCRLMFSAHVSHFRIVPVATSAIFAFHIRWKVKILPLLIKIIFEPVFYDQIEFFMEPHAMAAGK